MPNLEIVEPHDASEGVRALWSKATPWQPRAAPGDSFRTRSSAAFAPEVAVLDIGLQDMDGYQLAQELCKRPGAGVPAMIALSGYGQESDRRRSTESGFTAHFVKPVSVAELLGRVASI